MITREELNQYNLIKETIEYLKKELYYHSGQSYLVVQDRLTKWETRLNVWEEQSIIEPWEE